MDVRAIARLSVRQQLHHALQATNLARGDDMEDAHAFHCPSSSVLQGAGP